MYSCNLLFFGWRLRCSDAGCTDSCVTFFEKVRNRSQMNLSMPSTHLDPPCHVRLLFQHVSIDAKDIVFWQNAHYAASWVFTWQVQSLWWALLEWSQKFRKRRRWVASILGSIGISFMAWTDLRNHNSKRLNEIEATNKHPIVFQFREKIFCHPNFLGFTLFLIVLFLFSRLASKYRTSFIVSLDMQH